jgi:hypothetical protein
VRGTLNLPGVAVKRTEEGICGIPSSRRAQQPIVAAGLGEGGTTKTRQGDGKDGIG